MSAREINFVFKMDVGQFDAATARATELTAGLDRAVLIAELDAAKREIQELKNDLEVAHRNRIPCECRDGSPSERTENE